MSVKVSDKDHGAKKRIKDLEKASKPSEVTIGIHAADGARPHGEEATVLDVAIWNHFGTSRGTPARPFLLGWYEENKEKAEKMLADLMRKHPKEQALELFGLWCVGQVQAHIAQSVPPPNAPSTVARKGSSTTLIDTGVMRSSITHEVK